MFKKMLVMIVVWLGLWAVIYGIVLLLEPSYPVELAMGVCTAAAASLILTVCIMSAKWEGRIEEICVERKRSKQRFGTGRGSYYGGEIPVAYIRTPNGGIKKVPACREWEVGDYLVKRRGDMNAEVVAKESTRQ